MNNETLINVFWNTAYKIYHCIIILLYVQGVNKVDILVEQARVILGSITTIWLSARWNASLPWWHVSSVLFHSLVFCWNSNHVPAFPLWKSLYDLSSTDIHWSDYSPPYWSACLCIRLNWIFIPAKLAQPGNSGPVQFNSFWIYVLSTMNTSNGFMLVQLIIHALNIMLLTDSKNYKCRDREFAYKIRPIAWKAALYVWEKTN